MDVKIGEQLFEVKKTFFREIKIAAKIRVADITPTTFPLRPLIFLAFHYISPPLLLYSDYCYLPLSHSIHWLLSFPPVSLCRIWTLLFSKSQANLKTRLLSFRWKKNCIFVASPSLLTMDVSSCSRLSLGCCCFPLHARYFIYIA